MAAPIDLSAMKAGIAQQEAIWQACINAIHNPLRVTLINISAVAVLDQVTSAEGHQLMLAIGQPSGEVIHVPLTPNAARDIHRATAPPTENGHAG